jgi:two-component system, OmpR family, sensor histidine kinase TctE
MARPHSLRLQLVAWTLLPMLVVLSIGTLATYLIALRFANRAYDYSLQDEARTIAARIDLSGGTVKLDLPHDAREVLEYDPLDRVYFDVRSRTQGLIAGTAELPLPEVAPGPDGTYYDGAVQGSPLRLFALPIGDDLQIVVAETLNKRNALPAQIVGTLLLVYALLIAVAWAMLWHGTGNALLPLRHVVDALAVRGQYDMSPVDPGRAPAELRHLAEAVNDLMARLEQSISTQHRFIADAAHQLRTPLAGLLAQIEGALQERDPEAMREALERLQLSAKRAARLVNQLLAAARAEPGQQSRSDFERIDLVELARKTCMEWVPEALRCGRDLGFEDPGAPAWMLGNTPLLEEMLGNLIENAIRYGREAGTITVGVTVGGDGGITARVADDGPPIPAMERDRLFDRFYRIPGSPGGGSGLGLAIVRDIARVHHGDVELRSGAAGNVFVVAFAGSRVDS